MISETCLHLLITKNMSFRVQPAYLRLKEELKAESIGKVHNVNSEFGFATPDEHWYKPLSIVLRIGALYL